MPDQQPPDKMYNRSDQGDVPPGEPQATVEPEPEQAASAALSHALKVSFAFLKFAVIAAVFFYLVTGIFYVHPQEVKFKLRMGQVVPSRGSYVLRPGSGLHLRLPLLEEVVRVPTLEKTLELDKEFWTDWPQGPGAQKDALEVPDDGFLITGDKNIVHMKLRARYQVRSDAKGAMAYAFGVENPEAVLRRALMDATSEVVGSMGVMDVINRKGLFTRIEQELQKRLDQFERNAGTPLGLTVVRVEPIETGQAKNPTEPYKVSNAFYEAQNARSMADQRIQEGKTARSRILNEAQAQAAEIKASAKADAVRLVRSAEADAQTMAKLLPIYTQSRKVANILRDRFYKRAVEALMREAPGAFIFYEPPAGTAREMRFMLGTRPPARTGEQEQGEQRQGQ